jgi:glycosyltransferase involved in cell wall biosynthesis
VRLEAVGEGKLGVVAEQAHALSAEVVLLHVLTRADLDPAKVRPAEARARTYLETVAAHLEELGVRASSVVCSGPLAATIVAEAEAIAARDPRIEILLSDQPRAQHLELFAGCDICLSPSRWEGLGLPLYEATAFGMPVITNDDPPMNEIVRDGLNGLLVASHPDGQAKSGIPARAVDVDDLAAAIERVADPELRERLAAGARRVRRERSWDRTVAGMAGLLERVMAPYEGTMTASPREATEA